MFSQLGPTEVLIITFFCLVIGLLPTWIAFKRKADHRWMILVLNVLLGGTGIGWFIALWFALRPRTERRAVETA
ncbi:superinfection immunity protein [Streptomyces sp. SID8379]|uniref:superinfection immunity protein n=1 Tax=unclassified Streptomyces TaxID=2593676 RepID=UPI000376484D|nr:MULTISPECIES: superinfection immunity protein [unclassified Streptomyces]MYW65719.1 superinfection immunity protein [Streptomyces sp. SID8379]